MNPVMSHTILATVLALAFLCFKPAKAGIKKLIGRIRDMLNPEIPEEVNPFKAGIDTVTRLDEIEASIEEIQRTQLALMDSNRLTLETLTAIAKRITRT